MTCLKPFWLKKEKFYVPCGRCLECKKQRTLMWANRLVMERSYWKDAAFVTLTYEDVYLPPTLVSEDLQKFFKRLRRDLPERPIKYFACGEYGSKNGRPHYHAIIFGLSPVVDREVIKENWPYCDWQVLESSKRGRKSIGTVTFGSCHYVAGYIQKKLIGSKANEMYAQKGIVPPFVRMSKGLGLQFALDNQEHLKRTMRIGFNGYVTALPRYFRDKLGVNPEIMKQVHYLNIADKLKDVAKRHPNLKSIEECAYALEMETYGSHSGYEQAAIQREIDLKKTMALRSNNEEDFYDI